MRRRLHCKHIMLYGVCDAHAENIFHIFEYSILCSRSHMLTFRKSTIHTHSHLYEYRVPTMHLNEGYTHTAMQRNKNNGTFFICFLIFAQPLLILASLTILSKLGPCDGMSNQYENDSSILLCRNQNAFSKFL